MTLVHWGCSRQPPKSKHKSKRKTEQTDSYFTVAAKEGLIMLMKLMLDIDPGCLHEQWVVARSPPLALYRRPDVCSWLWEEAQRVRTLQECARSTIWKALRTYQCERIYQLPIPDKLKHFTSLNCYFPDEIYCKKNLDKLECPFDCLSACPQGQCPRLDFSSGSEYEVDLT